MSDIRNRLLYLAEAYPEMSHHFLNLARQGVGEGVVYSGSEHDYYDHYSEMMAEATPRALRNPISNSCTPLQKHDDADPNPTSRGSGNCYQKHYEYGSAGSSNKKEYMKKYRELQKAQYGSSGYNTPAPNGSYSGGEGRPKGGRPNPNSVRKKKADLKKNSSAREQLEEFRFRRAAWRHPSIRKLRNNSGSGLCFTPLKEWGSMSKGNKPSPDFIAYVEALAKGDEALGQCYHRHHNYGDANAGKPNTQARRDYDKWYYENVKKPAMQSGKTKHFLGKRTKTPIKNHRNLIEKRIESWEDAALASIGGTKLNNDLKKKMQDAIKKLADKMRTTRVTPDVFFAGASKKTKSQISEGYRSDQSAEDFFSMFDDSDEPKSKSESKPKSEPKSKSTPKSEPKSEPRPNTPPRQKTRVKRR